MSGLPQYPAQPTRSIVDAVDVLAETGPTLGRPLVDRIELEPDHRDLTGVFGRRLKEPASARDRRAHPSYVCP